VAELADALASGASDRKIIGVRLSSPAQYILRVAQRNKKYSMADCIFCKIINKEIPAYVVWEDDQFLAMLDIRPVNPGHLLIIPKQHIETIFDIPQPLYNELFETVKALSTPLQKAMDSIKVGVVVEGFGVPHAHVHLIPINHAHELDSSRAREVPDEELAAVAQKIKEQIKKQ
jgi:histidine triad (HIT) family protein